MQSRTQPRTAVNGWAVLIIVLGVLAIGTIVTLQGVTLHEINENESMLHKLTNALRGTSTAACDDGNPCTANLGYQAGYCQNPNLYDGTLCKTACLVPNATTGMCEAGTCTAEAHDCVGACSNTSISAPCPYFASSTGPAACLGDIGCPALPIGVPLQSGSLLPYYANPVVSYCALQSCRYSVYLCTPSKSLFGNIANGDANLSATQELCSELLNASAPAVKAGCFSSVRIDYTTPPSLLSAAPSCNDYSICTFFYTCAPYNTLSPVPDQQPIISSASANVARVTSVVTQYQTELRAQYIKAQRSGRN